MILEIVHSDYDFKEENVILNTLKIFIKKIERKNLLQLDLVMVIKV